MTSLRLLDNVEENQYSHFSLAGSVRFSSRSRLLTERLTQNSRAWRKGHGADASLTEANSRSRPSSWVGGRCFFPLPGTRQRSLMEGHQGLSCAGRRSHTTAVTLSPAHLDAGNRLCISLRVPFTWTLNGTSPLHRFSGNHSLCPARVGGTPVWTAGGRAAAVFPYGQDPGQSQIGVWCVLGNHVCLFSS